MPVHPYPFIDIAVHDALRERFARGDALVLFTPDLAQVLWANGAGAAIFGAASIYEFLDRGPSGQAAEGAEGRDVTLRQIAAAAGALRAKGDRRSLVVRIGDGFRRAPTQASVERLEIRPGEPVVLFAMRQPHLEGDRLAQVLLSGFDGPDTHIALLDGEGRILRASAHFNRLGITPRTLETIVSLVAGQGGRLMKRPIPTARGYLPAAVGRMAETPAQFLLFAVETILGTLDGERDLAAEVAAIRSEPANPPLEAQAFLQTGEPSETEEPLVARETPEPPGPSQTEEPSEPPGPLEPLVALADATPAAPDHSDPEAGSDELAPMPTPMPVGPLPTETDAALVLPPVAEPFEPITPESFAEVVAALGNIRDLDHEVADISTVDVLPPQAGPGPAGDGAPGHGDAGDGDGGGDRADENGDGDAVGVGNIDTAPDATSAPQATPAPPAAPTAFQFSPTTRTARFVWKIDSLGRFREVSPEFAQAVGPRAAAIEGETFRDLAALFQLDPEGRIADLLQRRDTWSGRTIYWPIEGTSKRVPVDLAALPTYTRNRDFDGFRGFGVVRLADAVEDPEAVGLSFVQTPEGDRSLDPDREDAARQGSEPAPEPAPAPAAETDTASAPDPRSPPEANSHPEPDTASEADSHADKGLDADEGLEADNGLEMKNGLEPDLPPSDRIAPREPPALFIARPDRGSLPGPGEAGPAGDPASSKIIRLQERRNRIKEGLSAGEQAAFREIARTLEPLTPAPDRTRPDDLDPPADIGAGGAEAARGEPAPVLPAPLLPGSTDPSDPIDPTALTASIVPDSGRHQGHPAEDAGSQTEDESAGADGTREPEALASATGPGETSPGETSPEESGPEITGPEETGPDETGPGEIHGEGTDSKGIRPRGPVSPAAAEERDGDAMGAGSGLADPSAGSYLPALANGRGRRDVTFTPDMLDMLPVALLAHRGDHLIHANAEFLALAGYGGLDDLIAAGGLGALLQREDLVADESAGQLMVQRASGDLIPVSARLQSIRWEEASALLLALVPQAAPAPDLSAASQAILPPSLPLAVAARPQDDAANDDRAGRADTGPDRFAGDGTAGINPVAGHGGDAEAGEAGLQPPAILPPAAPPPLPEVAVEAARLRTEVEELRSILETATDGVVTINPDGTIRSVNGAASALFNYDETDLRARPFVMLFAHESQRSILDYLAGLNGDGVASVLNDGREVIGREAAGGFIPLFMTIGRLSSSKGFCAVIRDITQWKRTEEELRNAKRAAETANAHKSDFLARVSHEIRTPLNAIIGFSDIMADERFGPIGHPRYGEYASDIGRSGRHVLDIVNDLLDISKIEAGQMDLDFVAVGLNETVAEAVALVQPQANGQRVIIRTALSQAVPDVVADLRSVKQIVLNILANAIRFTPSGGQIIVSTAYEANGSVSLRVRDTGIGMTRSELEQAMKPFRQVSPGGSKLRGDGTGLGLPLTKAMVDANRASFTIQSTPNEGTLVEITFPSPRVLAG